MKVRPLVENAYAKINWTLEVLGKRDDGYHEVRTILQTVNLCDTLTLTGAFDDISIELVGPSEAVELARAPTESNLAYRAAALMKEQSGSAGSVRIELAKRIPVAAGLGGGSGDAAAALRGLNRLWELRLHDEELLALGAQLGSDVPFFIRGGTALAAGRGELINQLPDVPEQHVVIVWEEREMAPDKTARMYAALRSEHYTDGARTETLVAHIRAGEPVRDEDCFNVFEGVLSQVDAQGASFLERVAGFDLGQPHLCGSGPALFLLVDDGGSARAAWQAIREQGFQATYVPTVPAISLR